MLDTQAELRNSRRGIVYGQCCSRLSEERLCCRLSSHPACAWIGEVNVGRRRIVEEGRSCGSVVDIVALQTLVEGAETAAQNRLSVSEQIVREAYARLQRL